MWGLFIIRIGYLWGLFIIRIGYLWDLFSLKFLKVGSNGFNPFYPSFLSNHPGKLIIRDIPFHRRRGVGGLVATSPPRTFGKYVSTTLKRLTKAPSWVNGPSWSLKKSSDAPGVPEVLDVYKRKCVKIMYNGEHAGYRLHILNHSFIRAERY